MVEQKKRTLKKKTWRWLKITVLVVVIVLLILQGLLFFYISPVIERLAKEAVYSNSAHLYSLSFRKFHIGLFSQSITISDLYLTPDTVLYEQRRKEGTAPPDMYTVYVPELNIGDVGIYNAIFEEHIDLQEIYVREPQLQIKHNKEMERLGIKKPKKKLEMKALTSSQFSTLTVRTINMNNASFLYSVDDTVFITPIAVNDISLYVKNLRVSDSDTGNVPFADDAEVTLQDYKLDMPDGFYALKMNTLKIKPITSSIHLDSLTYTPKYGKYEHGKVKGYDDDRLNIRIKSISICDFDIKGYLNNRAINARSVFIDGMSLYDFRDNQQPAPPGNYNPLPVVRLLELPNNIKIDTVNITDGFVLYEEHAEGATASGSINFADLNLTLTNLTNDSVAIIKNPSTILRLNAMVMGKASLHGTFNFALNERTGKFTCAGTMGKLNVTALNQMLEPAAHAKLEEGIVDRADFHVTANDNYAVGVLHLYYHDLKITITDENLGGIKRRIGSFIVNKVFVKSGNPDKDEPLRNGKIFCERDKTKAIFSFCWKAMLSGIASSLGVADDIAKASEKKILKAEKDAEKAVKKVQKKAEKAQRKKEKENNKN